MSMPTKAINDPYRDNLSATLIKHDAAINGMSSRIGHVEKTLGDHGAILITIEKAVTKQDHRIESRPVFDFHKYVGTVLSLAVLFSMVVAGIIYVAQAQFGVVVAEQKALNATLTEKTAKQEALIEKLAEKVGWVPRVEPKK